MDGDTRLPHLLAASAARHPERIAVYDPQHGEADYAALAHSAGAIATVLERAGVAPGDRVGILAPKSVGVVASIFGILSARAAYVPVDSSAPLSRAGYIFDNCAVAALIVARNLYDGLAAAMPGVGCTVLGEIEVPGAGTLDLLVVRVTGSETPPARPTVRDLAYILYTSGSTGVPKGVMHSHASALSFVDWCSGEFAPGVEDTFSSHAPFHFDLSIFDLFVSVKHGARLVLIGEETGKHPQLLAALIAEQRISVWYSTPSILRLLVEYGKLGGQDCTALRLVLYAGEVFPVKHQRALRTLWPHPRYYNLYGPTETNVCTFDRVAKVPDGDEPKALPIGRVCSGNRTQVADAEGKPVPAGEEGELLVSGGSVMLGYWNLPEQNARAFHADDCGTRWYRTGDVVVDQGNGYYLFLGRRDRMVKRRGYRVELGEIEAALHRHPHVTEAAAVAMPDADSGVLIKVFIDWNGNSTPSLVEMKGFAAKNLPAYMVPDRFAVLPAIPKTSTDKIDYQKLRELG